MTVANVSFEEQAGRVGYYGIVCAIVLVTKISGWGPSEREKYVQTIRSTFIFTIKLFR